MTMQQTTKSLADEHPQFPGNHDIDLVALGAACGRMVKRWRLLADRIEAYAPPAAAAYRQSAEDLESEMREVAKTVDMISRFRDELCAQIVQRLGRDSH